MSSDSQVQVKDSAAWTLGRVCERCPGVIIANEQHHFYNLLKALVASLGEEARVAVNTCWVIVFECT